MPTRSSTSRSLFGEMTPEYAARRAHRPIPPGYVLVQSPARIGLVHLVKANTFKDVAVRVIRLGSIRTLCDTAATGTWTLLPRNADNAQHVTCARCRVRLGDAIPHATSGERQR